MGIVNIKTAAEVEAERIEQAAASARNVRNQLLKESDPTQLPDAPLTDADKIAWADYRQALRDVPQQAGFPDTIDWPVMPN